MSPRLLRSGSGGDPGGEAAALPGTRGLSPVVGKSLELGIGVLLVALLTATFFGSVAPDYRAAVGAELGDRTLAAAADRVEAAAPGPDVVRIERRVSVRLPDTIRGSPYRIVADGGPPMSVRLVHPDAAVGGRIRLVLPASATISGSWRSSSPSEVIVAGTDGSLSIRLTDAASTRNRDAAPRRATEGPA
jgi:hypothetical protein